jgi:hypothetical protein
VLNRESIRSGVWLTEFRAIDPTAGAVLIATAAVYCRPLDDSPDEFGHIGRHMAVSHAVAKRVAFGLLVFAVARV